MKQGMTWGSLFKARWWAVSGAVLVFAACSQSKSVSTSTDRSPVPSSYGATAYAGDGYRFVPSTPEKTPSALYREVNVKRDFIPRGKHARKYRRYMRPRYITIHSTQNFSRSADALRHSVALKNGKLRARKRRGGNRIGYLVWHYTVDQTRAVQHLPTNEQGEHADFDGPGNRYSIGIEMCENRGNSRSATIERTAKLAAYLMHKYDIPLRKVVPHYHWPRRGCSPEHKNCPHYLLDNGHPGAKWQWFLSKVNKHYKSITPGSPVRVPVPEATPRPSSSYGTMVASAPVVPRPAPVVASVRPAPAPVRVAPRPVAKKPAPLKVSRPKVRYHTVRKGDTLYSLARRYKTSVSPIQKSNGLRNNTIGIGQSLTWKPRRSLMSSPGSAPTEPASR